VAEELAVGDPRIEGVARPAGGERIDVDVSVEHDGRPAARAAEPRDGLLPPGFDLLQRHLEPLPGEVVRQPLRAPRLLGGEGGDADQVAGEADDLLVVDLPQHPSADLVTHMSSSYSMAKCASVVRPVRPLIGKMSWGHAENATTRSISARKSA
jgi:hypothetical protein